MYSCKTLLERQLNWLVWLPLITQRQKSYKLKLFQSFWRRVRCFIFLSFFMFRQLKRGSSCPVGSPWKTFIIRKDSANEDQIPKALEFTLRGWQKEGFQGGQTLPTSCCWCLILRLRCRPFSRIPTIPDHKRCLNLTRSRVHQTENLGLRREKQWAEIWGIRCQGNWAGH